MSIFYQIFFNQSYQNAYRFNIKTVIDAGANIGLASIFFANKFPNATIIAVEPQENNFELLRDNTNKYENIMVLKKALWGSIESVMSLDQGYGESGFITKSFSGNEKNTMTVDSIMRLLNLTQIDILKIDIEGSEKEVFEGNHELWLPYVKCLIIELHDRFKPGSSKAVFKAICNYNFRLELRGENLFFFNLDLS